MTVYRDFERLTVIAPNFKRRLSGVTSTIIQLVPQQTQQGIAIATLGPGLPDSLPKLRYRDLWRLWKRPNDGGKRLWHARRNTEMIGGIILRDIMRMPLHLLFTSASQRRHKPFTKWLINRMDFVIATSAKTASYLDVPHQVIMHGIDTYRFAPPNDKRSAKSAVGLDPNAFHIGCFGRIRPSKGTDIFVSAMQACLPDAPQWHAVIAGRATEKFAPFERKLRATADSGPAGGRIQFVGEHTNIEQWYQAMDVFVAPQRWEGFGLTPLEAMACGVPVVATDVGAFREIIIDSVTGYICDDEAMIATHTRALIGDAQLLAKMAEQSRIHVEAAFGLSTEANALIEVYRKIIGGQS